HDVQVFRENVVLQQRFGIPVELLEPADIARVLPNVELTLDDVLAASYCGKDGVSDPAGVTEGYRKNATRLGVTIYTEREVTAIDAAHGRVTSVRTNSGNIATRVVVNAAGPYAAIVGKMAGIEVPIVPLRRCIWTTKPFPQAPPRWTLVIDFSSGF